MHFKLEMDLAYGDKDRWMEGEDREKLEALHCNIIEALNRFVLSKKAPEAWPGCGWKTESARDWTPTAAAGRNYWGKISPLTFSRFSAVVAAALLLQEREPREVVRNRTLRVSYVCLCISNRVGTLSRQDVQLSRVVVFGIILIYPRSGDIFEHTTVVHEPQSSFCFPLSCSITAAAAHL